MSPAAIAATMRITTLPRFAATGLIAAAGLALLVQTAAAEAPAETAIRSWVASIDASPDWQAAYTSLTYDAATQKAVLTGLAIHSQVPGIDLSFGTVALTGFALAADGGFTASRITADEGSLEAGPFKLALSDAEVNGFAMPALPALNWDAQHPFTSLIKVYAPLSRLAMTNGRIGEMGVIANNAGVSSRIVYDQFRIDRWADGKIAAVTAGPLSMVSPSPDGLMNMKVASFEAHDIDIDAVLRVFDPDRYTGGVGDGIWHKVSGLAAYHDFAIAGPGVKMTMTLVSTENFKLRQPRHSFAGYLDRIIANPNAPTDDPESARAIVDMLSAYGLDRLGISRLDIASTGMNSFHLGGFNISDLSIDRLGEFAIDDFATDVPDVGAFKLGHFAIGKVALPGVDTLVQAILAGQQGGKADAASLAPKPGFIEMSGLDVAPVGSPRVTLGKLRVDLADYVGALPTSISASVGDLVVPVSALGSNGQSVFAKLGYDTLDIGYRLKAGWNATDETLAVDHLQVDLKDAGGLALSMLLGGLPRAAIESPASLPDVLPGLSLKSAALTLKDDSIVGKGLDLLAEKMHANPQTFRQQFATAMPLLLSLFVLHDPKVATLVRKSGILAKLAPVVKDFVAAPGSSVTLSLAPPTPVAFPAISAAAENDPASLVTMLGLTVDSSAAPAEDGGGKPPPKTPVPADKAAPPVDDALRPTTPAQ